ncbi:MAG: hypothetical protein WAO91_06830 [Candidatus Nitrosotenuis sp.]
MKKIIYLLIGILVLGGFGIFGFVVGESVQQASIDRENTKNVQSIPADSTEHNEIAINS